ncbi:MAG: hypothetical protein U0929_17060 [Planctomycetaceae bacterium]
MHPGEEETDLDQTGWWSRMIHGALQPRILGTVVLAGLFVVVIPAFPSLWPTISQRDRFKLSVDAIELTAASNWAPHDVAQRVAAEHREWNERSLLDSTLVADLAEAFAKHPWIEKVDRVEKTRQGRVIVQVTYRTPVAMIPVRGLYPVDANGVLLPPSDFSEAEANQLPRLEGIKSLPNGKPGEAWGDPIVVAGAKLCSELIRKGTLDSHWARFGLKAVIAPPPPSTAPTDIPEPLVFQLVTKGTEKADYQDGRLIIWGRAPGDDTLEPTVEQKLGRLEEYLNRFKSLELPEDGQVLDLRPFSTMRRIAREKLADEILR